MMSVDEDLKSLFLAGRSGDKRQQHRFLSEAAVCLRAYFRNRLHNRVEDMEDLVQITLISLHTRRDSYDERFPLSPWLYAIARYRLYDFLRHVRRRPTSSLDGVDVPMEDYGYDASDARGDVARLLAKLPEKQRMLVRMTKLEECSVRDVAVATGYSDSDIKISVHRGLKALRRVASRECAA